MCRFIFSICDINTIQEYSLYETLNDVELNQYCYSIILIQITLSNLDRDVRIVPWQEVVTPRLPPAQVWKRVGGDLTAKHDVPRVVGQVSGRAENAGRCRSGE